MSSNALEQKRKNIKPSPSSDPYFADPANLAEIESRVKSYKEEDSKATVTLKSTEDITKFINSLY